TTSNDIAAVVDSASAKPEPKLEPPSDIQT
ncbi:hypothetical protein Tco_0855653, partial [Tanacetum coccineum]